eukprot:TRINITY_DN6189_c0_g1_i1.p1 TRINITY_DN6189_c0_g1~~TRINITY_DN6189_c0_g1_i1.p1  ORF type:complete len:379 (+),score=113.03 TRINITY_DN6189_c0_g1_i1:59-1195(+)
MAGVLANTNCGIGRQALLGWLNDFLQSDYERVEQLCSGVAHCQLMDAIYPGKVPLHKVNFDAKFDYEYARNFKVLQEVFKDVGLPKVIDVNQILKGKYMDNMEFFQWMKKHFDDFYVDGRDYDPVERRERARQAYNSSKASTSVQPPAKRMAPAASAVRNKENKVNTQHNSSASSPRQPAKPTAAAARSTRSAPTATAKPASVKSATTTTTSVKKTTSQATPSNAAEVARLNVQLEEQRAVMRCLQDEVQFFYDKLRLVEIVCQEAERQIEDHHKASSRRPTPNATTDTDSHSDSSTDVDTDNTTTATTTTTTTTTTTPDEGLTASELLQRITAILYEKPAAAAAPASDDGSAASADAGAGAGAAGDDDEAASATAQM